MIEPFIKWAGGKRQLVDVIRPIVVERCASGVYHEPFLGGGAVALSLGDEYVVSAGDACRELIAAWRQVQQYPDDLSRQLEWHRHFHSKTYYYEVRLRPETVDVAVAARFIYLNKTGFNGLYRVNSMGRFNVPIGRGRPSAIPTRDDLRRVSRAIRYWVIGAGDFEQTIDAARAGDVVYADPPYCGTFDYASGFGVDDRLRLSAALRRAVRRGATAIVTDADTESTRRAYQWMELRPIDERRRVAANGDRSSARCLIGVRHV